ncbi:hypothetical protein B9Z55_017391 [Caenorhabditis nigoni]|nr:hypothetical protein B9Z55_017391 [Caenorhabditis nigoni]
MVLIFFIALNRCLVIVKDRWSDAIFEGKRVIVPVVISLVLSILGAYYSIQTSKIKRTYQVDMGFVDLGEPNGFRRLITRLFYIFPLASVICYLIIFFHLKKNKNNLLGNNKTNNQGQQNVFIQILITVFFYGGSFFFLLITLALSVIFRTLIFIITFIFAAFSDLDISSYSIPTTISLYVDAISANFSMVLIFFIALNRCLVIVKTSWSEAIFEGKRVIVPVIISLVVSILGAYLSIRTSKITRRYDSDMGFIDFGEPNGFRKLIARIFYIFPLASAICYLIIFYHLKKNKKKLLVQRQSNNKGQQNVFIQILITVFFYGIMSAISEYLGYIDQAGYDIQITLISLFNLLNYLPELSLPFLLVVNNCKPKKRAVVVVAVSQSNSITRRSDVISIK